MKRASTPLKSTTAVLLATGFALAPTLAAAQEASNANATEANVSAEASDVTEQVAEAVDVVGQMEQDPDLAGLMEQARGIYIVPDFGRGALVVGASGGSGMMLEKQSGSWSTPAFYNMGGVSFGAQAGASAGAVAFLLMSEKAVEQFHDQNSFSLNAEAGISIVDYSATAQESWGKGDVVVWSDTEGLFAGAQIGVSDIFWDGEANAEYYGAETTPRAVLSGEATMSTNPIADALPG